ncbi:MAG: hypothetical protein HY833_03105 [Candidatus Aenigmarchaeota archaeon]|nr:hypothetical protein [Candidatus Aenigmarchaeota archaeon]
MADRSLSYKRLDDVKIKFLEGGPKRFAYVLHQDSNRGFSDITELLEPKGISYTGSVPDFAQNYSLFASKDKSKIEAMSNAEADSFTNRSKLKETMLGMYRGFGLPECCIGRVERDAETGIMSMQRIGMQLVDFVDHYHLSGSNLNEKIRVAEKASDIVKSVSESKKDWSRVETAPTEPEKRERRTNDDSWMVLAEVNEKIFKEFRPKIERAVLNVRLARELPLCRPDCEKAYDGYTSGLVDAAKSLGYEMRSVSDGAVDFLQGSIIDSYFKDGKTKNIGHLEAVVASGILNTMKKVSDVQLTRINDAKSGLRSYEQKILSEM